MRKLAYVENIRNLKPITGADKIECAEILGWECVVKKNEFQVGDLCIYVEVDSVLPNLPAFEFMKARKYRVRTIRLKQQISQGLVFPLSIINEVDPSFNISNLKVEDDVTDLLKITKYDPEVELDEPESEQEKVKKSWLRNKISFFKWKLFGIKKVKSVNGFPSLVPKTDEIRVQNMFSQLEKHVGKLAYVAEKLEGSSITFVYNKRGNWLAKLFKKDYVFQACSRNRTVFNSDKNKSCDHYIMNIAKKYNIEQGLISLNRNLAIQAESIGPKIQKNIYKLPEVDMRVFSAYDIDARKYLSLPELVTICDQLNVPMVPIVKYDTIKNDIKYYVELSKGKSELNSNTDREGIVVRTLDSQLSFKSINPEYLLSQKD